MLYVMSDGMSMFPENKANFFDAECFFSAGEAYIDVVKILD